MPAANHSREFERFVSAVHRRMTVLRAVERIGLCVLGGCAVAAALSPILMTRGEPTGSLILATLGASIVAGLFWGTLSRPSRLAAATEVDRQLRLADLLGTAVTLRANDADDTGDEMAGAVLALADARCRATTPATVVLHRFGARGWGGIGLALAFVVGLNLLGPDATHSANRASARAASWGDVDAARDEEAGRAARKAAAPDLRRAKTGNGSDDAATPPSDTTDARSNSQNVTQGAGSADQGAGGGNQDGTGAGTGQSTPRKTGDQAITARPGDAQRPTTDGRPAGGGGPGTGAGPTRPGDPAGTTAGQGRAGGRRPAPVWESRGWADDRGAAEAAVQSGRVPDAYRDLVRGYFQAD